MDSSRGSCGRTSVSPQTHEADTMDTSSYRLQKVDKVHRASSLFNDKNMTSSPCYHLVDEDNPYGKSRRFPRRFHKCVIIYGATTNRYICYRTGARIFVVN